MHLRQIRDSQAAIRDSQDALHDTQTVIRDSQTIVHVQLEHMHDSLRVQLVELQELVTEKETKAVGFDLQIAVKGAVLGSAAGPFFF
jgi:hypothetical protein